MVADIEELEEMGVSELHVRRLNAKEVLTSQRSGNFTFPVADGTVKIFGAEQRLRPSTLTRDRPERGEEQEILQRKSDELHSPTPLQGTLNAGWWEKLKVTSGRSQENAFIVITLNRESNCTCPREETFPIPMKYIDVTRTTCTSLDVSLEKNISKLLGTWMEKERLSDAWTGFTIFVLVKEKATRRIHTGPWRNFTRKQTNLSSWWCVAKYVEIYARCTEKESKTEIDYRETKAR